MGNYRIQRRDRSRLTRAIQIAILVFLLLFVVGLRANVSAITSKLLNGLGFGDDTHVVVQNDGEQGKE